MIYLGSDNEATVRSEILRAIVDANQSAARSYGEDDYTAQLKLNIGELFETELEVFPVLTGTAANAIALAQITPSYGAVICHEHAHINTQECGAPEFFTRGKLLTMPGPNGKITADALRRKLIEHTGNRYHSNHVSALSLTQATEYGTVYSVEELEALCDMAHEFGLLVHMDGARFANAVTHLGCTPAELSWRAGIDILSFGSTKNGTLNADAILVFDTASSAKIKWRLKQAGQLASKMRYVSAQLIAYLEDNRWINWAGEANRLAQLLVNALEQQPSIDLVFPVQANFLIVRMEETMARWLADNGVNFYPWHEVPGSYRWVLSNMNRESDVTDLITIVDSYEGR